MEQKETGPKKNDSEIKGEKNPRNNPADITGKEYNNQSPKKLQMETIQDIDRTQKDAKGADFNFILDIPLQITAELGRTELTINDLLQLGKGSVIEFGKLAGEPIELMVHQKPVARGEAVRVNKKIGVKLTDIITPEERIENLR